MLSANIIGTNYNLTNAKVWDRMARFMGRNPLPSFVSDIPAVRFSREKGLCNQTSILVLGEGWDSLL